MIDRINSLETKEDVAMSGLHVKGDTELADMLNKKILEINDKDGVKNRFSYQILEGSEVDGTMASGVAVGQVRLDKKKPTKIKEDAVQKQSTTDMDADKQTADVQEMVEGKPTTEPEVVTKEEVKDEGKKVTEEDFELIGKKAKREQNGKIIGQWILDNAKEGDTITDEDGNGYEVTYIGRRGEVELTSFEIDSDGNKQYNETEDGVRLVSKAKLNQGDLFEYGYTDLNGNKVVKQYKYNTKSKPLTKEEVKDEGKELTEEAFKEFTDTGKVSEKVVDNISEKVKEGKPLTKEEEAIRQDKSTEIEEKLKETVVQEGTDITKVEEVKKIKEKVKPPVKKVLQETQRVHKKIKDVLPDFEVVVHETEEGYNKQMKSVDGPEGSEGLFTVPKTPDGKYTGRIDINLSKASGRTVSHEIAHGVMLKEFGKNPRAFKNVQKKLLDVLSDEQVVELNEFIKQYEETEQPEEFLAEMSALLTESGDRLSQKGLKKIMAVIAEFISKYTGGKIKVFKDAASTKEVADFFNSVSDAISRGEQVAVKETPKETMVKEEVKEEVKEAPKKEVVEEAPIEEVVEEAPVEEVVEEAPVEPKPTKALPEQITEGKLTIEGVSDGYLTYDVGNPVVGEVGRESYGVQERTRDGLKMFTLSAPTRDGVGRLGNYSISLTYPANTDVTLDDVSGKLEAMNKRFTDNAQGEMILGTLNQNGVPVSVKEFVKLDKNKSDFDFESFEYGKDFTGSRIDENTGGVIKGTTSQKSQPKSKKASPEQIAEGKLSIAGSTEGFTQSFGRPLVSGDTRSLHEGFREDVIGDRKIFSKITPSNDRIGRGGNHTISLGYPADTDVTLDDVKGNLEAMNKKLLDGAEKQQKEKKGEWVNPETYESVLTTLSLKDGSKVSLEKFIANDENKSVFNFKPNDVEATYSSLGYDTLKSVKGYKISGDKKSPDNIYKHKGEKIVLEPKKPKKTTLKKALSFLGGKIKDATKPIVRARKSAQEGPELTPKDFREAKAASKESLQEQIEIEDLKEIASKAVLQRRDKTKNITAISNRIRDLQEEKKLIKESPEFVIADNLPKINPKSAARETGGAVGTRGDISIGLTSKKAGNVEAAAEDFGTNGQLEGLLGYAAGLEDQDIRNIIIEILLKGKKKFKSDILEDVNNDIRNQRDRKEYLQKQKPVTKAKQVESVNNFVMDSRNQGYSDTSIKAALNSYDISKAVIDDALNIPTTGFQQESRLSREQLQERIREISKGKKVKLSAATVKNIAGKINKAKLSLRDGSINEKEVNNIINYIEGQYDKASDRAVQIQEKNKQIRKDRREKAKKIKQEKKDAAGLEKKRKELVKPRIDEVLNRPNDVISTDLKRLFARDSKTIPASVREEYAALVKVFAVPETKRIVPKISEIQENLNAVNDAIDMRDGNLEILKNAYESFDDKVLDDKGKINYAATLERMVAKGDITEADAKLMKKPEYKKVIDTTTEKTQEEKEESKKEKEQREKEEKASLIKDIKDSEIDAKQVLKTQSDKSIKERMRKNLDALQRLIKSDLNSLDNKQLKTLQSAIASINNGTFNHAAYKILVDLETNSKGKSITPALKRFSKYTGGWENNVTKALSKLKAKVVGNSATEVELNTTALEFMELVFGKKDGVILYESVFESSAESQEKYVLDKRSVDDALVKIQEKLYRGMTHEEMLDSSYSISAYLINQEAVTNEGNKEVNAEGAKAFLDETITKKRNENTAVSKREVAALRKVKRKQPNLNSKLTKESVKEQYNKFSAKEKLAIQGIQKINQGLAPKAAYTAAVIRGKNFSPRPDYVHISTLKDADTEIKDIQETRERFTKPSTKSGTGEERTGKASPINFDVFTSVSSGATQTLLDYHLTTPLKIGATTLRKAEENLEKDEEGVIKNKKQREAIKALQDAYKTAAEEVIGLNDLGLTTGPATKALRFAKRQSYRAMLAGAMKGAAEALSNVYYATVLDRKALQKGYEIAGVRSTLMGEELLDLMMAVDATTITRLFPKGLAGRLIDRSTAMDSDGVKRLDYTRLKRGINKLTESQYAAFVASAADAMLSTPDKLVMRVFWTGSFVNELSELTGEKIGKEQLQKISQDAEYKAKYKEEIKKAKRFADKNAVLVGNSSNPFTGALAGRSKGKNEGAIDEALRTYNNFLVSFMRMEWTAFRKGMQLAFTEDSTPKEKRRGHALMTAAAGRVLLYPMAIALTTATGAYIVGADDDDERGIVEKLLQNLSSMFVSLFLGRGSGQISRAVINFSSELLNKEIREGMGMDYDAYKNSIAYSPVPVDMGNQRDFQIVKALAGGLGGPISPQLKWVLLGISILARPEVTSGTKKHTKERYLAENWRFWLEPFGLLGMIPFYKDLRFLFMKHMYRNVGKKSSGGGSISSPSKKPKTESKFDKNKKFGGDKKFGSDKKFDKKKF